MGPLIFSKNLGMGFRLWLNPFKRPIEFLILGMPIIAVQLAWMLLMLALDFAVLMVKFAWELTKLCFAFIAWIFSLFRKEETA